MQWVIYENITCSVVKRIPRYIWTALYIDFPVLCLLLMPFFPSEPLAFRRFLKVHGIVRGQKTTSGDTVHTCLAQLSGFQPRMRHHGVLLKEREICICLLSSKNTHGKDCGLYLLYTVDLSLPLNSNSACIAGRCFLCLPISYRLCIGVRVFSITYQYMQLNATGSVLTKSKLHVF